MRKNSITKVQTANLRTTLRKSTSRKSAIAPLSFSFLLVPSLLMAMQTTAFAKAPSPDPLLPESGLSNPFSTSDAPLGGPRKDLVPSLPDVSPLPPIVVATPYSPPSPVPVPSQPDPQVAPTPPPPVKTAPPVKEEAIVPAVPISGPAVKDFVMTVQKGDTIWALTAKSLAQTKRSSSNEEIAAFWPRFYDNNTQKIANPNLIYPGQVLVWPKGL